MNRKIIIKMEDFNREICFFLTEVMAGMPMDWNIEALGMVRNAVIRAFEKMGITVEINDQPSSRLIHCAQNTKPAKFGVRS
jgi:hypothetical protein